MGVVAQWKRAKASPLNQRRWLQFKANRRGYWSFWLFILLFFTSLFAVFIANDKPVLIRYQQQWMMPVVSEYTELDFGGDFDLAADYSDPYIQELITEQGGWMLWPPVRFSYGTINYNLNVPSPSPPTGVNWLGTDDQGRDVFSRLLYGFRLSVLFALVLAISSSVIGVAVGAMQGYFGGRVDLFGQRFIEIWSGMPQMFLLIILSSLVQPNFWWLLGILLLFSWMSLVDVVRAEFLRGRNLEYVKAARALGVGDRAIMARHILPNAMIATLTFMLVAALTVFFRLHVL